MMRDERTHQPHSDPSRAYIGPVLALLDCLRQRAWVLGGSASVAVFAVLGWDEGQGGPRGIHELYASATRVEEYEDGAAWGEGIRNGHTMHILCIKFASEGRQHW